MEATIDHQLDYRNEPDPGEKDRADWWSKSLVPAIRQLAPTGFHGTLNCNIVLPRWLQKIPQGYNLWSLPGDESGPGSIRATSGGYVYEGGKKDENGVFQPFVTLISVTTLEIEKVESQKVT